MKSQRTSYGIASLKIRRLHLQQWLWNMQLGWDLHPSISLKSDGETKIADHGCGNAYVHN
jgi:hypothetical protein